MCLCILNERRIRERGKTSSTSTMLEISNLWIVFDALESVKGNKLYRFIHSSVCNFSSVFLQNFAKISSIKLVQDISNIILLFTDNDEEKFVR